MKKCDPNARARCPDGKYCELYAEFADGSWCDTFNDMALKQHITRADFIRASSDEELAEFLLNFFVGTMDINGIAHEEVTEADKLEILRQLQQPPKGE